MILSLINFNLTLIFNIFYYLRHLDVKTLNFLPINLYNNSPKHVSSIWFAISPIKRGTKKRHTFQLIFLLIDYLQFPISLLNLDLFSTIVITIKYNYIFLIFIARLLYFLISLSHYIFLYTTRQKRFFNLSILNKMNVPFFIFYFKKLNIFN